MDKITDSNYELFLLQYAEGMLSDTERDEVEAWLASHPEAAEELALYSEAPRLGRNDTVTYVAAPPRPRLSPFTFYLSPLLRWSAAAAVLAALMVPALRMGTMGQLEPQEPLLIAAAQSTPQKNIVTIDTIVTMGTIETKKAIETIETTIPEELPILAQQEDTLPLLPPQEPHEIPAVIPSENLIVYLPAPDTIYSDKLLIYDDSRPRLRDLASEWIEDTPISKFFRHNLATRKTILTVASNQ